MGLKKQKAREKEIPHFVFEASQDNIKAFLDGYLLGDGTKGKNFNRLFTSSIKLTAGLSLLARLADFKSGIHKTKENKYQLSYSYLNNTDPFWPLWDFTKQLYSELRKAGYKKKGVTQLLSNIRTNTRLKTTSFEGVNKLLEILPDGELKIKLQQIKNSNLKTERIVRVKKIDYVGEVYDLSIPTRENFLCGPHPIFAHNSMDAPLVLTTILVPAEVDTEVHGLDIVTKYPLEFYEAALAGKFPGDVKIEQIKHRLNQASQYENLRYTHEVSDLNSGVNVSAYKQKPTMVEKLEGQIDLADKIRAVDLEGVASLVIDKHFIRDIKGNLRQFTGQEFRCIMCNEKYRRPPFTGFCTKCNGKLVFTIAEGTIKKYLEASMKLAMKDNMPPYLRQTMVLLQRRIESIFGREKTKQIELESWFK